MTVVAEIQGDLPDFFYLSLKMCLYNGYQEDQEPAKETTDLENSVNLSTRFLACASCHEVRSGIWINH